MPNVLKFCSVLVLSITIIATDNAIGSDSKKMQLEDPSAVGQVNPSVSIPVPIGSTTSQTESMSIGGVINVPQSPTLQEVYNAKQLFTCKTHKEIVTSESGKNCPNCSATLTAMTESEMNTLRAKKLNGCIMEPIVVERDQNKLECPKCNMPMIAIDNPKPSNSTDMIKPPVKTTEIPIVPVAPKGSSSSGSSSSSSSSTSAPK